MARPRKPMALARSARGRRRRGSGWSRARLPATRSRDGRRASQAPPSTASTATATTPVTAVPAIGPAVADGPPGPLRPALTITATTMPASRKATRTVRTIGSGSGPRSWPDGSWGRDPSGSRGCQTSLIGLIVLRAPLQQGGEGGLVQGGDTQLGGPGGLGAGVGADDDVGGLLGDAGGDPAAAVLDGPGGLLAAEAVEAAGEDEGHAGQGLGQVGPGVAVGLGVDAGLDQAADQVLVGLVGEPGGHAGGDGGADPADVGQLLLGGGGDRLQGLEAVGEQGGHGAADVADGQADQQPVQGTLLGGLDRPQQVGDGAVLVAAQGGQVVGGDPVDVGRVVELAGLDQGGDGLLAQVLDVHGPAAGEVDQGPPALGRAAGGVGAAGGRLALGPDQRGAALGAPGRELPAPQPLGPLGEDGADDLGDDVAGPADEHGAARADVAAGDLVLVVQGGQAHGGAGDQHRLQHRERGRNP